MDFGSPKGFPFKPQTRAVPTPKRPAHFVLLFLGGNFPLSRKPPANPWETDAVVEKKDG